VAGPVAQRANRGGAERLTGFHPTGDGIVGSFAHQETAPLLCKLGCQFNRVPAAWSLKEGWRVKKQTRKTSHQANPGIMGRGRVRACVG